MDYSQQFFQQSNELHSQEDKFSEGLSTQLLQRAVTQRKPDYFMGIPKSWQFWKPSPASLLTHYVLYVTYTGPQSGTFSLEHY